MTPPVLLFPARRAFLGLFLGASLGLAPPAVAQEPTAAAVPSANPGKASRGIVFVPPVAAKPPTAPAAPVSGSPAPAPPALSSACLRAFPEAELTLDRDGRAFDVALAKRLRTGAPRVVVDVARPFEAEALPPALDPWLAAVTRGGGAVRSRTIPCGRGFSLGKLLQLLFGRKEAAPIYDAAKGYDAALYHSASDSLVRQVVFTRRAS